ncbi:MAG TPA: glycosyltransferase family 4 protein [Actinomycetes bacterium]
MPELDEGSLRIAIVAPPWYAIPPQGYGGIESMVFWLAEGLHAKGHDVTVIGAGPRAIAGRFLSTVADPPSERIGQVLPEVTHALQAADLLEELEREAPLDVIHDHCAASVLAATRHAAPTVVTAHGPVDGEMLSYYRHIGPGISLVAVADFQRRLAPRLPWVGTVHNATQADAYPFESSKDDFCLFLGRMSGEKAPHLAIEAARAAGRRIVVAGKCTEKIEQDFFEARVRPLLGPDVEWVGEADAQLKAELLGRARCLVFPVQWNEPFGLVMVEAMACGTPVVALRAGAVPEVVEHGVTGFVCDRVEELPAAIERVDDLEPKACRQRVLDHFDVAQMAEGYERVFRQVAGRAGATPGRRRPSR